MVQREIKKKTQIYGTVATLSAIVLVALIYVYGSIPGIFTPDTLPETSPMKTFNSYDELKNFLITNAPSGSTYYGGSPLDSQFFGATREALDGGAPIPAPIGDSGDYTNSYSTTNIQVKGVDEADIVKTDGEYVYIATNHNYYSESQNNVYIVKSNPDDSGVVAKIELGNNTYVAGLFLSQDGNKLVIIGSQYQLYAYEAELRSEEIMIYPYYSSVDTFLSIYDISEKDIPVLDRNLTLSGSYFNSRMIGNYVYAVVSQPTYFINDNVVLPQVYENAQAAEIEATRIYYADAVDDTYFTFTTFIGLNIMDNSQEPTNMTIMMGGTSNMYVSLGNIYVTYPTWSEQGQYTSIYRVHVSGSELAFEAKGSVEGNVLNQYSMDEYNGYFRLATTSQKDEMQNSVYVLDMNLNITGKLDNLAKEERIYSARFMGDKCYLVTFRQIDPFFVLDMSNPAEPKVAGELKIPGYSSYLHPYNDNYVIGLGKEDNKVKLSLFDVSNVNAPTEVAKYIVEGDYTDSEALQEPKAFLFDKQKDLLVIPISKTQYGVISPDGVTDSEGKESYMESGFWQGAYVFKVSTSSFTLRGGITHQNTTSSQYYYGYDYNLWVHRALYIDNVIYTVSNTKVLLNNLENLTPIAEVNLQ